MGQGAQVIVNTAGMGLIIVDAGIGLNWVLLCDSLILIKGTLGEMVSDDEGVHRDFGGLHCGHGHSSGRVGISACLSIRQATIGPSIVRGTLLESLREP